MGTAESSFDRGVEAYDQGRVDDAVIQMREALEANPAHLDAHVNLALILADKFHNYDEV